MVSQVEQPRGGKAGYEPLGHLSAVYCFFFLVFFERVVALHNMEDLTASPLILAPQCPSQVLTCSLCYARGKPQLQDHVPSR